MTRIQAKAVLHEEEDCRGILLTRVSSRICSEIADVDLADEFVVRAFPGA